MLRELIDLRDQIRSSRVQFGNRLNAATWGEDEAGEQVVQMLREHYASLLTLERRLTKDSEKRLSKYAVYPYLSCIVGIGDGLAAWLLALIDITRCNSPSGLWKYAGMAVVGGHADRRRKGKKVTYNPRLKAVCFLIGEAFLKHNSPYRRLYDEKKAYYVANRPDWNPKHRHLAAMRYMVKIFLVHLWLRWRTLEGLPVTEPYVYAELNHGPEDYIAPEDMGWPPPDADLSEPEKPAANRQRYSDDDLLTAIADYAKQNGGVVHGSRLYTQWASMYNRPTHSTILKRLGVSWQEAVALAGCEYVRKGNDDHPWRRDWGSNGKNGHD